MLCPKCVVKEVGDDDVYQRWNGRISLRLTEQSARELFDEHWNPAPGEAARATPPGLDDRRMGRRGESEARVEGLEVRIEQLEKEVEELKTLATKVVGLTAEKDNLSSRHESTTGDLAPNHTW